MQIINVNKDYYNEVNVGIKENGIVGVYLHHDNKQSAMIRISTNTDFCARTDLLKNFANDLAMNLVAYKPKTMKEFLNSVFLKTNYSDQEEIKQRSIATEIGHISFLTKESIEIDSFVIYY